YLFLFILAASLSFHLIILNIFIFFQRLQFIIEIDKNSRINFLDVSTIINEEFIEFDWYTKSTLLGRF
ncbi:hypothetical protein EAG_15498, partial [Camponotus floridanus]